MVNEVYNLESDVHFYRSNTSTPSKKSSSKNKVASIASFSFLILIGAIILFFVAQFNLPWKLNSFLSTEDTSYQVAATTAAKISTFANLLETNQLDQDLISRLQEEGVEVKGNTIIFKDQTYTSKDLLTELYNNQLLYNAFFNATYGNLGDYYDPTAERVFSNINASRNTSSADQTFVENLENNTSKLVSTSSNTVYLQAEKDEKGNTTGYHYVENGSAISSTSSLDSLCHKIVDYSSYDATMDCVAMINATDAAIEDHLSELTAMTFNEVIDKTRAGDGNDADLNGAMELLTDSTTYYELNPQTGTIEEKTGAAIDVISPVLNSEDLSSLDFNKYSSDRLIKVAKNASSNSDISPIINSTIISAPSVTNNYIGRLLNNGNESPSADIISTISPTTSQLTGQAASGTALGYRYVRGELKVSERLAKNRGGALGDTEAILSYQSYLNKTIAMNDAAKRASTNPFDPNSTTTFLSQVATTLGALKLTPSSLINTAKNSLIGTLPATRANNINTLTSTIGNCETVPAAGGEGNIFCSTSPTFSVETILNAYSDQNFIDFVNKWTYLNSNNKRVIKNDKNSPLYRYLVYYSEQITNPGNTNANVLSSLKSSSSNSSIIAKFIELFHSATPEELAIANGSEFLNSSTNAKWSSDYQYAQTYIILSSVLDQFKMFTSDKTAYNNVELFEGGANPVLAFLDQYYEENPVDNSFEGYLARATGFTSSDIVAILEYLDTSGRLAYYNISWEKP